MRGSAILAFFAILALVLVGCAASDGSSPVIPYPSDAPAIASDSARYGRHSHRFLWGLYEISIDPVDLSADVVPMRIAEGHLNAVRFLEVTPCDRCITLTKVILQGPKRFDVDVQLRHPFVGLHKFTGFDVRGIVMFDPSFTFETSGFSFPDPEIEGSGALLNPDGYTTLFNPVDYPPGVEQWPAWEYQVGRMATEEFPSSTLNPYKSYQTDTRRHFFGCSVCDTQTYNIRFPETGPMRFGYAIDASWAPPTQDPPEVPDDFPLEANMPEPHFVSMEIVANTLWSQGGAGGGGDIRFLLKVYDHQDPRMVSDGGTVHGFRWEIDGMTGWDTISPIGSSEGTDSVGHWVSYLFHEAPVPDISGRHRCIIAVEDTETGIKGFRERAYVVAEIYVNEGESCWSPGVMISDIPSENYEAHLNNARNTFVDSANNFHLFYLDYDWKIHHLIYNGGVASDDIIAPEDEGFNVNAVPDSEGAVHIVYANDPYIKGGHIIYRRMEPDGILGSPEILSTSRMANQFQPALAIAPNGQILVLWMDSSSFPNRILLATWYDGTEWQPQIIICSSYLEYNWLDATVVADSSSVFHVVFTGDTPANLYYIQFADGIISDAEKISFTEYESSTAFMSIDAEDRLYITYEDVSEGRRGYFKMRNPVTGTWTDEIDLVGYRHYNNRYQNVPLFDGRLAVVWTDRRDKTRGLYSKVIDPFMTEDEIQAIADDEVDAPFIEPKNQTRLCLDLNGTLHLVWSDHRSEDHWQLFYSTCTP